MTLPLHQQQLTILGSTGSVGKATLAVVDANPQHFSVLALAAGSQVTELLQQCLKYHPRYVALFDPQAAQQLQQQLRERQMATEVLAGADALCQLAALPQADQVIAAIVGAAGLLPTLAAIQAGKRLLLANKESLVTCGALFMAAARQSGAQILPIDSEHNAIFQCLPVALQQALGVASLEQHGIHQLILTASGGPLRHLAYAELAHVTPEQACAHPNWSMGQKISVDSATMMNKGLEYIEARWLFNARPDQLAILVHPQSIIHAMIRFNEGSLLAQCSQPDMRIPIAYALAYPERLSSGVVPLDFLRLPVLTFEPVDEARYPCLSLAIAASQAGQAATTVLNAANEVAVAAFLRRQLKLTAIAELNQAVLDHYQPSEPETVMEVLDIDRRARRVAQQLQHYHE
ncbi:1-deoxy-D-xylulose-5-phosphate reductoisomerase [unidentified bacterial endosymbiont]|uniref:1-deoxy-D-xylulose-5-phosphate reductoisomerase n=1 Tax=unidentified bacterial endosymbiont TaxID=2355 RepID=UPI00209FFFC8|nr:1-deoxy-D-xylulose-5-phosphate reductoisomerase [unidentified bacterial endosymbiont]